MTKFFYLIAAFAACLLLLTSCLGGSEENPYEENLKLEQITATYEAFTKEIKII